MRGLGAGLAVVVLLLGGPAAVEAIGFEATPVAASTQYLHIGAHTDIPINTQEPQGVRTRGAGGVATTTLSCLPEIPGLGLLSASFHTFYGVPALGYVNEGPDGPTVAHRGPRMAHDVTIDTGSPAVAYLYLEQGLAESNVGADAVVTPEVMARVTVRTGSDTSVGGEAYNEGELIAQGEFGPGFLDPRGLLPGPAPIAVDAATVYELALPLTFSSDTIPGGEGYNVRIDLWLGVPGCDPDGTIMADTVRLWSGPDLRPRLEWSVHEPLRPLELRPWFLEDILYVNASVLSPWGVYDVDEAAGGVTLTIEGPTEPTRIVQTRFEQRHDEHFFLTDPVHAQWAWPYKEDNAAPGTYNVTLTAWNDQHTAQAVAHAAFTLGPRTSTDAHGLVAAWDDQESPAGGIVWTLLGVALIAALARRGSGL